MSKIAKKSTKKQIGYSILTAFIATVLTPILGLVSIGQIEMILNSYLIGIFILGFVIDVVFIATARYKGDVYLRLGAYLFILFIVLIIFLSISVGIRMGTIT